MYPPVPIGFPRAASSECLVQERFIPEGTSICVSQLATYRSDKPFKYANEFRPERWLGDPEFAGDVLDAVESFSVGPRNCVGKVCNQSLARRGYGLCRNRILLGMS